MGNTHCTSFPIFFCFLGCAFNSALANGYLVGVMNLNIQISSFIIELCCMKPIANIHSAFLSESCDNNFRSHADLALRVIHFQFSQVPSPALSDFCFLMLAEAFIMPCRKFHANFQSSTTGRCHSLISFVKSIFAFEKSLLLPFYSYVSCC